MFNVLGSFTQGEIYNEVLLGAFETKEEAEKMAKTQEGAWDEIIITEEER
jgi:hypothetical protein